jgi:nitroreductase
MELVEAIKGRRSIRQFKGEPVPVSVIKEIIEAGIWAPSAKNGQQWRFTVMTGVPKKRFLDFFREKLLEFSEKHGRSEAGSSFDSCRIMQEAPVLIIVWNINKYGWETEIHSVAAAIQNMLLRAYDLGLGSLWIGDIFYATNEIKEYLNKKWNLTAAVSLGYPDMKGRIPPKLSVDEVTEFIS